MCMAEVLPRHYVFGMIFFSLIVGVGIILINAFQGVQSTFTDTGNTTKYQNFQDSFAKAAAVDAAVGKFTGPANSSVASGPFGVLNNIINSAWNAVSGLFDTLGFMSGVFNGFATVFEIPPLFGAAIITLVTAMIGFAVFALAFYRDV